MAKDLNKAKTWQSKTSPKSRQQIYRENYQKNKETKKAQRRARYAQQKQQAEKELNKYYQADSIKVLISLKEYTELNLAKQKLWLDFMGTFKKLNESGINDIVNIVRLEKLASNLTRDYWEAAQNEIKKGKNWNSLSLEQQAKLIKYWSREKARQEQNLADKLTEQEKQSKTYEKDLELAKFHEERGKIKCECWQCKKQRELQTEIKKGMFADIFAEKD